MSNLQLVTSEVEETPSTDRSLRIRRSLQRDRLITFRESSLDLLTGTESSTVLNESSAPDSMQAEDLELPAELKRFLDMARLDAMDDQGYYVDYDRLKKSAVYHEYRQECSPRLGFFDPGSLSSNEERTKSPKR